MYKYNGQIVPEGSDYYPLLDLKLKLRLFLERLKPPKAQYMRAIEAVLGRPPLYAPFTSNRWSITQGYRGYNHPAIDWGMPNNTGIYAAHAGRVARAGVSTEGYGYYVAIVNDSLGVYTLYAHFNGPSAILVKIGDNVGARQLIGRSDNTGNSTGPHLHFEARFGPYYRYGQDGYDPLPYLTYWTGVNPPPQPPPPPPTGTIYWLVTKDQLSIYREMSINSQVIGHYTAGTWVPGVLVNDNDPLRDWMKTDKGWVMYRNRNRYNFKR